MAVTGALVDTSVLIATESGRRVDASAIPDIVAISTVTLGELRLGVLSVVDPEVLNTRLATYTAALLFAPLAVDEAVANAWAQMQARLRAAGRRMPVNDSWIAAIALAHGLPLLTMDDDYDVVDGLEVVML